LCRRNLMDRLQVLVSLLSAQERSKIEPRYLYSRLLTDEFIKRIGELERGAIYPAVRESDEFNEIIPVPPLPEQRKIAGVLELVQRGALGSDIKGKISPLLYIVGVVLAFVVPWLSIAIYVPVAVIWLIPDRRIERALREI
jgi:hypothetical protein